MFDRPFREHLANLTQMFISQGVGPVQAHTRALAMLYRTVQQQAQMSSYLDVFQIMAVGCLSVVGLVLFLKKVHRHDKPPAGAH